MKKILNVALSLLLLPLGVFKTQKVSESTAIRYRNPPGLEFVSLDYSSVLMESGSHRECEGGGEKGGTQA